MTDHTTNRERAWDEAARIAADTLAHVDCAARCAVLGLPAPGKNGGITMMLFGRPVIVSPPDFTAYDRETGLPARPVDRVLALHYLLNETPVRETGELISFRDLPGGAFYLGPFLSRTVAPLVKSVGSDLGALRARLGRFTWSELTLGDLGARIHAVGALNVTLVYRAGDDEFAPSAEVLFDAAVKRALSTEDAAAIATRACTGLL
jgi:hypothetical protein